MTTILSLLALAGLATVCLQANAAARPGNSEIVVSPKGDDTAKGTAPEPVATLHRAQVLVREAVGDGLSVRVTLMGGVYRLGEPLVLTQEDSGMPGSPVLWQAAPGERVTISGGTLLRLQWEPYRDGIFRAQVPADFVSDQLFVNGMRQHMARYPNYDPSRRIFNGYAADAFSPERAARWADPRGGYIHAMHAQCGAITTSASPARTRTAT